MKAVSMIRLGEWTVECSGWLTAVVFSAKKRDIFKDFGGSSLFGNTLNDMETTRRDFMTGMSKPQTVQYKPTGQAHHDRFILLV